MKVLAFGTSNSKRSINKALVKYACQFLDNCEVEVLDLNDFEMPIFSVDRETETGIPEQARIFFKKISDADGLVISLAEHNGGYTAAFKNIFDWASRVNMKVYQDKPTVFFSASMGPGGAGSVMSSAKKSAPFFGSIIKGTYSVPSFFQHFDFKQKKIITAEIDEQIKATVKTLFQ